MGHQAPPTFDFLIDSGSTSHWAADKSLFTSFNSQTPTRFTLADGKSILLSHGTGTIAFVSKDTSGRSHKITIDNVHHSPTMGRNILSVQLLLDGGFSSPDFNKRTLTAGVRTFQLLGRDYSEQPIWRVHQYTPPHSHQHVAAVDKAKVTKSEVQ